MTARDEPVDIRLVPAALAVWGAAAVVLPWSAAALLTAALLIAALLIAALLTVGLPLVVARGAATGAAPRSTGASPARRSDGVALLVARPAGGAPVPRPTSATRVRRSAGATRVPPEPAGARRRWHGQTLLALGAVAVLLLTTASQVQVREDGDLRALAADGARVRLVGVVRTTPQVLAGGGPSTVRFLLATRSVQVGDAGPVATGAAVDVLVPAGTDVAHGTTVSGADLASGTTGAVDGASAATAVADRTSGATAVADLAYGTTVEVEVRLSPVRDPARRAVARARATGDMRVRSPPPSVLRAADGLRTGLVTTAAGVPGDAGRLLPAVAVGDTRGVGDLDDAMRVSGLAHITAVSGAHFSLLGAVVLATAARCRVPRRWRWLPVSVVMAGFVVVVQPGSSVVRAAVMGAVGVLGIVAGRPARSVPALACAVLVLVVVDPWLARDIGFVLSVVATAGIALLAGPLARRWSSGAAPRAGAPAREGGGDGGAPGRGSAGHSGPPAGPLATALAVPVAAQAVCAPVILVLSPAVPTYAVLANVVAAPAVGPATIGGLLAALLGLVWPAGAQWCAQVAGAACWWIAAVARTATGLPGAQVAWAGGVLGQVLLACACAAALVLVLRCRRGMAR